MAYIERPIHLPGRHEDMPKPFSVTNHPLLKNVHGVRKVYVGLTKTDWSSMKRYYEYEKSLTCPGGDPSEWAAKGKNASSRNTMADGAFRSRRTRAWRLSLLERYRGINGSRGRCLGCNGHRTVSATSNAFQSYVPHTDVIRKHHELKEREAFDLATQRILGPKRDRHQNSTAFEDTGCARKVNGARAYTLGSSVQKLRKVIAPNASLAQTHRESWNDYQGMAKDLVEASLIVSPPYSQANGLQMIDSPRQRYSSIYRMHSRKTAVRPLRRTTS